MILFRSHTHTRNLAVLIVFFCRSVTGLGVETSTESHPRPMELPKLLNLLPTCPDTWLLKRSQARTLYRGSLEAYAIKEFQEFIPPDKKKTNSTRKPETVVMVIRDTCGIGPHIEPFRKETAPTFGGDFKLGNWDRYPAMLVRLGKNRTALRVLVAERFVVEVVFSGSDLRTLKWWLGRCKLKTLAEAKPRIPITIRDQVMLHFLDELHPERNRNYSVPIEPVKPNKAQEIASE